MQNKRLNNLFGSFGEFGEFGNTKVGPIVYRLGHVVFILERGVRFPLGPPSRSDNYKKMDNKQLNFNHIIPIEVFHESDDVEVEILINDQSKFKKVFTAAVVHKQSVAFDHLYEPGQRNKLKFIFSGKSEAKTRYLKLNSININSQNLNVFNANYVPTINQEWWDSLSGDDKEKYLEVIYGKNGATYGWYGTVDLEYITVVDQKGYLQKRLSKETNDIEVEEIISRKLDKIFLFQENVLPWNNQND